MQENRHDIHECGTNFREAVCIHTDKVFDSCRDKDYASYIFFLLIKNAIVFQYQIRQLNTSCRHVYTLFFLLMS